MSASGPGGSLPLAAANRIVPLDEAIATHVTPGSSIFIATESHAAVRALVRVFYEKAPKLTVVCLRAGAADVGDLLHTGLVRKLVAASFGTQYPTFRPSPLIQRAWLSGTVQFECWSLVTLVQRLMAGALGVPFLPTRSLAGSSLARGNPDFAFANDPFTGAPVAVVSALAPDVAIVNALAADAEGYAIVSPPFEDDLWSTRAARKGVIVLAENVVPTGFGRRHPHLVRIPGDRVLAVCHVPFAAHPDPFDSALELDLPIQGYAADTAHRVAYNAAARDEATFRDWVDEWILGVRGHEEYIAHLPSPPSLSSRSRTRAGEDAVFGVASLAPPAEPAVASPPADLTTRDLTAIAGARVIASVVRLRQLSNLLVGVGQADVAASLAYLRLREEGVAIQLIEGIGRLGFEPAPSATGRQRAARMLAGTVDTYGTAVGGNRENCLAVLGAGQIDVRGNLNSTLANGRFLVGSGGSNDAASLAAETIAMLGLAPGRTVPEVEYVTCPGEKVKHLVTDHGVFRKGKNGTFELWRHFPATGGACEDDAIAAAQAHCGWKVVPAPDLAPFDAPSDAEVRLLQWLTATPGARSNDAESVRLLTK